MVFPLPNINTLFIDNNPINKLLVRKMPNFHSIPQKLDPGLKHPIDKPAFLLDIIRSNPFPNGFLFIIRNQPFEFLECLELFAISIPFAHIQNFPYPQQLLILINRIQNQSILLLHRQQSRNQWTYCRIVCDFDPLDSFLQRFLRNFPWFE